jgi:hypothetical protein
LICINPATAAPVSLVLALRIGFRRAISKYGWLRDHPELLTQEINMKLSITISALLIAGFMAVTAKPASAVIYCQYVEYPAGCTVRAGVVLRPRPVARAVATPGVGAVGTPMNRGGPVDRVGRR